MCKYIALATMLLWTTIAAHSQDNAPTSASTPTVPSQAETSKLDVHMGGGPATPLSPTSNYAGIGGNFQVGAGYKLDRHNSIVGEFFWQGLPVNRNAVLPLLPSLGLAPNVKFRNNLY